MMECHSPWRDRLSEYLEGDLSGEERGRLEDHLRTCAGCARTLEELEAVVRRARTLEHRPPPRDLWPGIEAALGRANDAEVAETVPGRRSAGKGSGAGRRWAWGRSVRITLPQLAAAALAVMLISGGGAWVLARQGPIAGGPGASAPEAVARTVGVGAGVPDRIAPELAELERALDAVRDDLDPATRRVLEKNLDLIDRAIADSRRALELDPANPFLERHLEGAYQRKLEYLRQAASVAEWSS
ncbi:MAG: hypothetical protein GWM92_08210 [Gemmatimonadetes bacterium]|nr:zf-HC2 domain-containing protein [Gemmatimonadota bacterium]NIR78626.1 zf-HC2 domain-containing protein [Gemmatimonadota bacterium]NIT87244.1 zf-HC2 domain-containing protein [Gemmatimonadota bacterium]NIU31087.1 zf-HC2 domain-containing protein [Gemmatimonadota bacterium]NIU35823.1 hypothetical protein [Gemmatimonadota bacterium]